jgi:hypothetical protein
MDRQIRLMLLVDAFLVFLFALANYYVWVNVNRKGYFISGWSPLEFITNPSEPIPVPPIVIPNLPFYIFCIAIAVNLYFIIKLQRRLQTKPTT